MPDFLVRPFHPRDRPFIRNICANTGFLGQPIDPVFEDRELFANFLTAYYTDAEPESCFLLEVSGEIKGYAMACCNDSRKKIFDYTRAPWWIAQALFRWPRYTSATKKYLKWLLKKGIKETPPVPPQTAHFHFNVLPEARNILQTRTLVDTMLAHLVARGEKAVYAQMVAVGNSRQERTLNRYGFIVVNKSEVTKYRDIHPEPVYLVTVLKDLATNTTLYGVDLAKKNPDHASSPLNP
jgi:hypothetical protein